MSKRKIKILFDANPLMGSRTGIGNYIARLVGNMAGQYPDEVELVGYYYNFLGRKKAPDSPAAPNIRYRPIWCFPGPAVNMLRRLGLELPIELLTLVRADFILYPNFLGHPSLFGTPNAPVVHDLTFKDYPSSGSDKNIRDLNRFVPRVLRRASFVMTVSEFSKGRIMEAYHVPAAHIVTTFIPPPPPMVLSQARIQELLDTHNINKPFLLFVGTMEPRKNITTLLDAYAALPRQLRDANSLVLIGKLDWKYQDTKDKLERLQANGLDIKFLGYVDNETQAALFHEARLLVLPSLYEGFGMQIVEALSYGTPCAVSDIAVFHEVGGDMVSYFNHQDAKQIAQVLGACLAGPRPHRKELQAYIATKPDWKLVSTSVMDRIKSILNQEKQ